MAQKVEIRVTCDLPHDGETAAAETVSFAFDGKAYELDVCGLHKAEFDGDLGVYVAAARPVANGHAPKRYRTQDSREYARAVRAWANGQGIAVSERGRIPGNVVSKYEAAKAAATAASKAAEKTPAEPPAPAKDEAPPKAGSRGRKKATISETPAGTANGTAADPPTAREWAKANGITLKRGPVPKDVMAQYEAAMAETAG